MRDLRGARARGRRDGARWTWGRYRGRSTALEISVRALHRHVVGGLALGIEQRERQLSERGLSAEKPPHGSSMAGSRSSAVPRSTVRASRHPERISTFCFVAEARFVGVQRGFVWRGRAGMRTRERESSGGRGR